MTAVRLVVIILAVTTLNLGVGLAGVVWGVESIKWRERKEQKDGQTPPAQ